MANEQLVSYIDDRWENSIIPSLCEFIRIPNKSPMFDAQWIEHGHMERAVQLVSDWCRKNTPMGMDLKVVQVEGRTPLIVMDIPAFKKDNADTVLLYGHLDKQPEFSGWKEGLGPWDPVLRDGKLYGRGGADDGYAAYAALTAISALQKQGIPHARCVILIEACEESGSYDLPFYVDYLKEEIGTPSLVVCLDSGCGNYDQLWVTTSLRGVISGNLKVEVLREGLHSGKGSGVVPSSFRVLRQLLSRIEDEKNGNILLPELQVQIPEMRVKQVHRAADALGEKVYSDFAFIGKTQPIHPSPKELLLNQTWRPTLCVTGVEGIPNLENAGNVLRPYTSVKLSLRIPPTCNIENAESALKKALLDNPPYGAQVSLEMDVSGPGWHAQPESSWLSASLKESSTEIFGKEAVYLGEGGSIPFMGMLGEKFPDAQFVITGVLGPASNAHGPNEFLHIDMAKKVTACISLVLRDHAARSL